jgi:DNA-binding NarL/FixJ family response regulator
MTKKKVFIIASPVVCCGLEMLIEKDFSVCGTTFDYTAVPRRIEESKPDLTILDITHKYKDNISVVKDIREKAPTLPILVVSGCYESVYALQFLSAGADGYMMLQHSVGKVISVICKILTSDVYLSRKTSQRAAPPLSIIQPQTGEVDKLNNNELNIYILTGMEFGFEEITHTLHCSAEALRSHYQDIKEKLGFRDTNELRRHAISWTHKEYESPEKQPEELSIKI